MMARMKPTLDTLLQQKQTLDAHRQALRKQNAKVDAQLRALDRQAQAHWREKIGRLAEACGLRDVPEAALEMWFKRITAEWDTGPHEEVPPTPKPFHQAFTLIQ